jgi:NADP-dependent 3-hydroxy acid dehydrogenase YdfG
MSSTTQLASRPPVCAIVGAGSGNGAAFARRFSADGYRVALLARDAERLRTLAAQHPGSLAVACDAIDSAAVQQAFARVERELGAVDTLIFNAGNYVRGGVESTTSAQLESSFRLNAVACLASVQQVVGAMKRRGSGAIVVIGATASLRGKEGSLPFAAAKAGQRVMVQSMARELGPAGIHVAYIVIDAVIASPRMRLLFPCRAADAFAQPDDVAAAVALLVQQPRSAWTFELDLRPHLEKW